MCICLSSLVCLLRFLEADLDASEMDAFEELHLEHSSQDAQLEVFIKRCKEQPHQRGHVLRYAYKGKPLWPFSAQQLKEADVPPCACGAKRHFEFQVRHAHIFLLLLWALLQLLGSSCCCRGCRFSMVPLAAT